MNSTGRKPFWLRFLLTSLWVVLACLCLAGGSLFGYVGKSPVASNILDLGLRPVKPQEIFANDLKGEREYLNLLILGCDEDRLYMPASSKKPGSIIRHKARSDMMMVAKVDFKNKRISGISIPRDLTWQLPGYREMKVNAYYSAGYHEGGFERAKEMAKEACSSVTGMQIDRVVVLDYEAFQKTIDSLGGVEVFVPRKMDYDDFRGNLHIHLKKGRQTLNGYDAMCYARYRHGDDDFKRQERQKDLMVSLKDRVIQHWQQTTNVLDKSVEIMSNAFTPREMAALMLFAKKVGTDNIKMDMVPVIETKGSYDLALDYPKLQEKLKLLHMSPEANSLGQ